MSHMRQFIYPKGRTYTAECSKCGASHWIHEWITDAFNEERDSMQDGRHTCPDCYAKLDPQTFMDCGRMYAGRYSAPGYLDCASWHFSKNKQTLSRELRDLYAEEND